MKRCADLAHCPNVVKISNITGPFAKIPFSPATTVAQLREAVAKEAGWPSKLTRLIFKRQQLNVDAQTLGELGIPHEGYVQAMKLHERFLQEGGEV